MYGMTTWRDLFSPRQLLCHGTACEVFAELRTMRPLIERQQSRAACYLAIAFDKMLNYNSRDVDGTCRLERSSRSIFDRHDFAILWSYAEMAPLIEGLGYDWAIEQTAKCIKELIELTRPDLAAVRTKGRQWASV